jgi:hypothetical protein
VAIKVKNPLTLATFLVGFQAMVSVGAANTVTFQPTEPYRSVTFTAIRPTPDGVMADEEFKDTAIYYVAIGGYLYFSTSLDILHRVVDRVKEPRAATQVAGSPGDPVRPAASESQPASATSGDDARAATPFTGHMGLTITPANAKKSRAAVDYFLAGAAWEAEQAHLRNLWLVAHTVGWEREGGPPLRNVLGFRIESALGNSYRYDPVRDEVVGSVTGSLWDSKASDTLPEGAPLTALLRSLARVRASLEFTRHGLRTEVSLERN